MNWLNSIRARLALASALLILAVLTAAGLGLNLLFQSYIEKRVGQELRGRVLDLAGAIKLDAEGQPALTRAPSDPRYRTPYSGVYWYVREKDAMLFRSRSLWDGEITQAQATANRTDEQVQSVTGPNDDSLYLLERIVVLGEGSAERSLVLGVALDKAEIAALSSSFGSETATALGLMGVLLFGGAWLQASYGLKPLESLRQQLAMLHKGERGRLDGPFPQEVEHLTHDLNALFGRQREMILRARERAGTLAHGLKTPMTVLYGEARRLEVAGHSQPAAYIREQLDQIRRLLDRELARARAHGESASLGLHADLSATTERLVDLMKRMPRGNDIVWSVPPPGIHVAMDADDLGEVLGNLLDNARKWARSRVAVDAQPLPGGAVRLTISDDGPGIPDAFREKALERGEGTGNAETSSGLGLAIVSELIAPYGSELKLETSQWGGAAISMELRGPAVIQG